MFRKRWHMCQVDRECTRVIRLWTLAYQLDKEGSSIVIVGQQARCEFLLDMGCTEWCPDGQQKSRPSSWCKLQILRCC